MKPEKICTDKLEKYPFQILGQSWMVSAGLMGSRSVILEREKEKRREGGGGREKGREIP